MAIPFALLLLVLAPRFDQADEQYQFIVGLCEKGMFDMAAKEASGFLRDHADHPKARHARYRLATALFDLGKRDEALPHFEKLAAETDFEFAPESALRLGQCALEKKDFAKAAKAFDRALASGKDYLKLPATFLLGEAAFQAGDFATAATRYAEALQLDAASPYAKDARYGLAWSRFRLGDADGAIAAIDDFFARHKDDELAAELRFLKGEALLGANRPKEALAAYRAVPDSPFKDGALRGEGFARLAQDDVAGAATSFAQLLERFPDSRFAAEAALQCGIARLKTNDAAGALQALTCPAASGAGETPEILLWRSRARAKSGDSKAALADVEKALRARPAANVREQLEVARGDLLLDLGDKEAAAKAYAASESDYALHAAAVAQWNAGKLDEARALAQKLIERFPESKYRPQVELVLGECLLAKKDFAEAERRFAAAAAAGGESALQAQARIGWCRFLADDFDGASKQFRMVAQQPGADLDEALYLIGRAEEGAKRPEQAVAAWRKYVEKVKDGKYEADVLLGLVRVDPSQAAQHDLDELLARHADHAGVAPALLALADRLQKGGHADQAAPLFERIVNSWPKDPAAAAARYGLAYCRYDARQYAECSALLRPLADDAQAPEAMRTAALELLVWSDAKGGDAAVEQSAQRFAKVCTDPKKLLDVARVAGKALKDLGKSDAAERLWNALASAKDPAIAAAASVERVYFALDRKDVKAAVAAFERVPADAPGRAEAAYFVAEALFDQGDDARALPLYDLAAALPAMQDKALYKAGFARLRGGDAKGAEATFAALCAQCGKSPLVGESLFLLGESRYRQEHFAEAIEPLATLRQQQPKHQVIAKALFRLGLCCGKTKRWSDAEGALTELLRRFPEFENRNEAEYWRGLAFAGTDQARAAKQSFERVIAEDKGELAARSRIELGRLCQQGGDHERALAEFLKVAVLYSNEELVAESLVLAGASLEAQGDGERAKSQYQEVVAKYPASPFAKEARDRLARIKTL